MQLLRDTLESMSVSESALEKFLQTLHKTVFTIDRSADKILAKHGGTFSQFLVMTAVARCPGLSQRHIAEFLDLSPAAVSRQIDSFVESGHVERIQDPSSRRTHIVKLTKIGEKKYAAMKSRLLRAFGDKVSSLNMTDMEQATSILGKVLSIFETDLKFSMAITK